MGVITDEARVWADRDYPVFDYEVTAIDIARYARATGETNPIHYDRGAAEESGHRDVVAPTTFPYVIRMHASTLVPPEELEPDGSPSSDVPPLPTRRAVAGETSIEFGVPVVAGDVVTVRKRLADLYEFTNQRGEMVSRELFTRIYR
jgi:acyl dehydratase